MVNFIAFLAARTAKAPKNFKEEGIQNLSITTFRYNPLINTKSSGYLNKLNENLLNKLQAGGEAFVSNAIVNEKYCLRTCIVNFRTSQKILKKLLK